MKGGTLDGVVDGTIRAIKSGLSKWDHILSLGFVTVSFVKEATLKKN